MCKLSRAATWLSLEMKEAKSGSVCCDSAQCSRVWGTSVENVESSSAEEEEPGSDVFGVDGVVSYIHTLVTGGFNPHRRLHLESAGLWLDLQTCNLLYSIFPDVSYRMLKIVINSRI